MNGDRHERLKSYDDEQIQEFLEGATDVAFSNSADESTRRTVVPSVLKRYRYYPLSKGPRGVLFAYMLPSATLRRTKLEGRRR